MWRAKCNTAGYCATAGVISLVEVSTVCVYDVGHWHCFLARAEYENKIIPACDERKKKNSLRRVFALHFCRVWSCFAIEPGKSPRSCRRARVGGGGAAEPRGKIVITLTVVTQLDTSVIRDDPRAYCTRVKFDRELIQNIEQIVISPPPPPKKKLIYTNDIFTCVYETEK